MSSVGAQHRTNDRSCAPFDNRVTQRKNNDRHKNDQNDNDQNDNDQIFRVVFPLHDLDVGPWLTKHATEANNQRPPASSGGDAHRKSATRRSPRDAAKAASAAAAAAAAAAAETASPPSVLYDLVGLVQHTGGLEHGHYTAYARDDGSGGLEIVWQGYLRGPVCNRFSIVSTIL